MSLIGAVKRANAKGPAEESIPFRIAVLVAVLAAATAAMSQGIGDIGLRLAATAGIIGGFAYSHHARHREGYGLKAFLAVGVIVAFINFLQASSGLGAGGINELQLPLAELFLWVQVLHSLDVPARRDLLFSLLSSFVLIAVAGVLSVTSALGPFLLVWTIASLTSLVLAHRSELRDRPQLEVHTPSQEPAARAAVAAGPLRPVLAVIAMGIALAVAVFLILPAAGAGRAVAFPAVLPNALAVPNQGGLANPSLGGQDPASPDGAQSSLGTGMTSTGYFGFANEMDTGARGRPDDTIVMRVRANRPDFWRGQTFDRWDGKTWTQSDQRVRPVGGGVPIELGGAPEDLGVNRNGRNFVQTVYVESMGPNLVFAAYSPKRLYLPDRRVFQMTDGTIRTGVQLQDDAVYTVVSERVPVTEADLRTSGSGGYGADDASLVARYTVLPDDVPERVTGLATELATRSPNRYDLVREIERWMAANTQYTLDIPPLPRGADAVEQFLFVDQKGFCEQIASSLVVMLRSQGVPARLAVGYAPGTRNPFTGLWEVRARDAHAWAEVWFPGIGWQAFDPTASVPLAGDSYSSSAATGVIEYAKSLLPDLPDGARPVLIALVATATPLIAGTWALVTLAKRRRREAERSWADRTLARLERLGTKHGRSRRAWEPAAEYATTLASSVLPDPRVKRVAEVLEADAYAPGGVPADSRDEADRILAELELAGR